MFRFELHGVAVECETAEELLSVFGLLNPSNTVSHVRTPQAASWAEAARVAGEMGITKLEARKLLAKQRKKKVPDRNS